MKRLKNAIAARSKRKFFKLVYKIAIDEIIHLPYDKLKRIFMNMFAMPVYSIIEELNAV